MALVLVVYKDCVFGGDVLHVSYFLIYYYFFRGQVDCVRVKRRDHP